jgi:hypothetical protein
MGEICGKNPILIITPGNLADVTVVQRTAQRRWEFVIIPSYSKAEGMWCIAIMIIITAVRGGNPGIDQ